MLVKNDSSLLGDGNLSDTEALAELQEKNQVLIDARKLPGQELLENKDAARGRVIEPNEFIATLKKLQPDLLLKPSGVYGRPSVAIYRIDLSEKEPEDQLKYVTGFHIDRPLPEYSSVEPDERGLPTRVLRGWREVIVMLVKAGVISVIGAETKLGKASGARADHGWNNQVQGFKY